jgi:orotidine-5'-phosphate decarboxylase
MDSPIIIALDGMSREDSLALAKETRGLAWGFKAHELIVREGFGIISQLKEHGRVFVDLKFHEIPAYVESEVRAVAGYGADLITVHASGGSEMLEAAVAAGGEKVVAVTVLTAISPEEAKTIYRAEPLETVKSLARKAHGAGVRNIVCSPQEIAIVKEAAPGVRIITPGIRSEADTRDDQKRTSSPKEAVVAGADFLVIGRPITKAPHPRAALESILSSLVPSP